MKTRTIALFAASSAALAGCQTRITAEKYPERVVPIQRVVTIGGVEQVITDRALIASGGWKATARSPLWADEALEGLAIGVETNGTVSMRLDNYRRDLSTNAVAMVDTLAELTSDIAGKAVAALVGAYTGGTVSASSKLGALTLSDITGRAQVKAAQIAAKGAATSADVAKAAAEICEECTP